MGTPANSLNIQTAGIVTFNGISTFDGRTLTAGTGISITNGSGVGGNPTISSTGTTLLQVTGNSGVATPSSNNLNLITSNTTVKFVGSGSTITQDFSLTNLVIGNSATNITSATGNVGLGRLVFVALVSSSNNVAIGNSAGLNLSTGIGQNVFVGAGTAPTGSVITDSIALGYISLSNYAGTGQNTALGSQTFHFLATGTNNIGIGYLTGTSYTTTESSNILINNVGTIGESNVIRIGTQGSGTGQQNSTFMAGITGVTSVGSPVAVSSTGKLSDLGFGTSTQVLTSNGPGVSPTWQAAGGGGTPVNFQAYLTSTTSYPTGSVANVTIFDTAISNVGSGYNTTTGIFTAPSTGYYSFATTLFFSGGVGTTQYITAYAGSVQSLRLSQIVVASAITSLAWSMPMTAGDTVSIQPFADGTGNFQLQGGTLSSSAFNISSTFSGFKVN